MKHFFTLLTLCSAFFAAYTIAAEPTVCTMDYTPVCGEVQVQCIKAPCDPVQQTFGNRCQLDAAKARFLYNGECQDLTNCSSFNDGCNTCAVENGKMTACTMMYCETPGVAKCTQTIDATTPNLTNCTSYFDGCNTCFVENGVIGGCTKKYCDVTEQPKCLAYAEVDCPLYTPPSPDFCPDGTIIDGGKDTSGCQLPPQCEPILNMANPASVVCQNLNGSLDLETSACTFTDGTVCNERELFRGECTPSLDTYAKKINTLLAALLAKYEKKWKRDFIIERLAQVVATKLDLVRTQLTAQNPANLPSLQKKFLIFSTIQAYLTTQKQITCTTHGGERWPQWKSWTLMCNMPTKDAGKKCTDVSECTGTCLAPGVCSKKTINFGCMDIVEKGKTVSICID